MKTCIHTKTCTWMLITALFVMTPNWKQSTCSLTSSQLTCRTSIGMDCYTTTWIDLKCFLLSECPPPTKRPCVLCFHIFSSSWNDRFIKLERRLLVIKNSWCWWIAGFRKILSVTPEALFGPPTEPALLALPGWEIFTQKLLSGAHHGLWLFFQNSALSSLLGS